MQSPLRSAGSPDGPGATLSLIAAILVGIAILLSQTVFIVPAGNVAVVTTLGKVTGTPRSPGANIKAPLVQNTSLFDVRTQVRPEQFSTLTKDLQVIQATATVKYAMKPAEAGRIYETIATDDQQIYPRVIQPSLLKALKKPNSKTAKESFDQLGYRYDPDAFSLENVNTALQKLPWPTVSESALRKIIRSQRKRKN